MKVPVSFTYHTGIRGEILPEVDGAILRGSWDVNGNPSPNWASSEMNITPAGEDGCMQFDGTVQLESGNRFDWGVAFILKDGSEQWAIPTEIKDRASKQRYRSFNLNSSGQHERYYLTHCRRLGANKLYRNGATKPAIRFAVWAPNAQRVELVAPFSTPRTRRVHPPIVQSWPI